MTPEETREAGQLMLDWADQQFDVESQLRHEMREWGDAKPHWNWCEFRYRRKPTPKLRPYTAEECVGLVGREVRCSGRKFTIHAVHLHRGVPPGIVMTADGDHTPVRTCTPEWLLRYYTFADGSPCGVEE